jgi:hypothetical protein
LIDFVKILVSDFNPSKLKDNPLLHFSLPKNVTEDGALIPALDKDGNPKTKSNGDLIYKSRYQNAFYNGLEFKIFTFSGGDTKKERETLTIEGSLHKYWNHGAHNYNDFNFKAFAAVLKDFNLKFGITLKRCVVRSAEVGINIAPPFLIDRIVDYCFLHKTTPFEFKYNSDEGKYKQAEHCQYLVKLYNKTRHYRSRGFIVDDEILRFEIKYTKMERLHKLGYYTLQDFVDLGFLPLKNELINEWNQILMFDFTIVSDSKRVINYKNPLYWCEVLKKNRTTFYKHKRNLMVLTIQKSEMIQKSIAEIMTKKFIQLSDRGISFDHLPIGAIPIPPSVINARNIYCEITGINISMQKDDSRLLSHSGLKYYFKTDKKVFEELRRKYLTSKWDLSELDIQIKEIAHNIRNYKNNRKLKQRRIYRPEQSNILFMFNNLK